MNSVMGEWAALALRAFQAPGSAKSPWSVVFRWVVRVCFGATTRATAAATERRQQMEAGKLRQLGAVA